MPRTGVSQAGTDLGLGDALSDQVKTETEEERKKRLSRAQQMSLLGPAAMALGLNGTGGYSA